MIPIVAVVGKSNSGKTTLIEKLIPELNKRGYRVATVKHHNHLLEIDTPGKDSWRHKQAGAQTTFISTPGALAKPTTRSSCPRSACVPGSGISFAPM